MQKQISKTYQILTNLNCNLDCSYCYENKIEQVQNLDDIKVYFDYLLQRDGDNGSVKVFELIGGESLLYIDLLENIIEIAKQKFKKCFFALSSNGTLLSQKKVRNFIEKHQPYLAVGLSIDSIKSIHNRHRIYKKTRKGSYDDIVKNLDWYFKTVKHTGVKATFTKETIKHYSKSIINLIELGFTNDIAGNLIYEDACDKSLSLIVAKEFMKLIDYLFQNNLEKKVNIFQLGNTRDDAIYFSPTGFKQEEKKNWCGSTKYMTCLGFDGFVYGCNRFCTMNKENMHIGQLINGKYIKNNDFPFQAVEEQYKILPKECIDCKLQFMCPSCVAAPYETDNVQSYIQEKRMCGWTHALAIGKTYLAQRLRQKYDNKNKKL